MCTRHYVSFVINRAIKVGFRFSPNSWMLQWLMYCFTQGKCIGRVVGWSNAQAIDFKARVQVPLGSILKAAIAPYHLSVTLWLKPWSRDSRKAVTRGENDCCTKECSPRTNAWSCRTKDTGKLTVDPRSFIFSYIFSFSWVCSRVCD